MVVAKRRPPDHVDDRLHAEGVPDVLHAFSVHDLLIGDPVVCGPPATICNAFGVKGRLLPPAPLTAFTKIARSQTVGKISPEKQEVDGLYYRFEASTRRSDEY